MRDGSQGRSSLRSSASRHAAAAAGAGPSLCGRELGVQGRQGTAPHGERLRPRCQVSAAPRSVRVSRAHDDQSRAPLSGFSHDNGRSRTRALLDHQAAHVFGRKLHAIDERGGCQGIVSNMENGKGGVTQFGKPARHGHRRRRVDGAVERDKHCLRRCHRPTSSQLPHLATVASQDIAPAGTSKACWSLRDREGQLVTTLDVDLDSPRIGFEAQTERASPPLHRKGHFGPAGEQMWVDCDAVLTCA